MAPPKRLLVGTSVSLEIIPSHFLSTVSFLSALALGSSVKRDPHKEHDNPALQLLQDIGRKRRKGTYSRFGQKDW